ncbi:transcriptional regulator GlxA family with amidase domain [Oceanisphaera litoralis]|uniref:choline metabolism transcriptional regulator GbdR n=1 Tax=Oceanisphaera litoralis TaxID=225144 RepID=UPI00195A017E|nr:GlxA family transcriptional regulator [Oceanisphaera litoralis]MBM7455868.1 transcriptional regulator GlxA family with amidase domain [Oceanisphaera litoralis]
MSQTQRVGFLLIDNFTMISLASAIEPLRMANQLSGQPLYEWVMLSETGSPVRASDHMLVTPDHSIQDCGHLDMMILCGGVGVVNARSRALRAWLQQLARRRVKLGAVCTGSYLLADAGVLSGYRCTLHWEYMASFKEAFPQLETSSALYCIDRDRLTCSGGTVPMDMMLHLIEKDHSSALSTAICDMFLCERIREGQEEQRVPLRHMVGTAQPKLAEVVALMEANLEEPITLDELACYVGLSRRQVERLFQRHVQCSPSRYYLNLRLKRARQLLRQTSLSIIDIATACGFVSTPHFSKCYRENFGVPPRDDRCSRSRPKPVAASPVLSELVMNIQLDMARGEPTFASVTL